MGRITQHRNSQPSISLRLGLALVFVTLFFSPSVWSAKKSLKTKTAAVATGPALTIAKIEVAGNRKIETDAILARVKSKVGGEYLAETIREDIQSIFKTGYFYDITVSQETHGTQTDITYTVVEKPTLSEVTFEGNSELKTDELLEQSGLKAYEIFNMNKIREGVDKLQKFYEEKGYFLARIEPVIETVKEGETVKLTLKIKENDKVKVKQILFLGNRMLKDGFLKDRLETKEGGFFSFLSGSGSYKLDIFDRDMMRLRYVYFNEGYVQVKIDRPQVYVSPDKKSITISIRIEEGEQYDVGEIDFAGDILFPREELFESIQINKRKVYSHEVLQKDLGELQAKYGDLGYAFANVIPRTRINEKERKVDITFEFDKGNKVYFGHINVVGNSKTRDKVVRRELKVREGELYHETRKRKSQENVQRLGFFDEVNFKTSTPVETPDILNIDITVKERNTGTVQLGAGYGSATGFSLQGSVNQTNFLGKGQKLGAGLSMSKDYSVYNFNFTEPNVNDTDWSAGFDGYQSQSDRYDYREQRVGGAVRLGHPIEDNLNAILRYKYEKINLDPVYAVTPNGQSYMLTDYSIFPIEKSSGDAGSVTGILEYDTRNDRFSPSAGTYASTSLEYVGVGGNLHYTKGSAGGKYFQKLFWEVTWRNNFTYSYLLPQNGANDPPVNERFLLGGPYSLRGYRFLRVGKTAFSQDTYNRLVRQSNGAANQWGYSRTDSEARLLATKPFGGTKQLLYQMELEFPIIAEAQIKGVVFYDVGQAEDNISMDNFYSDVGFGFRWFSPIGPLRFEWGFPMRSADNSPDPVVFEFSIGSPF